MKNLLKSRRGQNARPATLRPGQMAAFVGVLALVLGLFAWYELNSSRQSMLNTLREGAVALAEAVASASEISLRAYSEIEFLTANRLIENARFIRDMEIHQTLSDSLLARIAETNMLFAITVIDAGGQRLFSSSSGWDEEPEWQAELLDLLKTEKGEVLFGFDRDEEGYAVAVPRAAGGAIVVRAEPTLMLEVRKSVGTGRLIQEIGGNEGVVYMVLQDTSDILVSSRQRLSLNKIKGDPFLERALAGDSTFSRLTEFEGETIFEAAMPFQLRTDVSPDALLRIGLSIDALETEEARYKVQLGVLGGLLLVLGAVGVGVLAIRQNYTLLDEAYTRIQTYSSRILEQMAEAVVATDKMGKIQVFNQAAEKLFGQAAEAVLERDCFEVLGEGFKCLERTFAQGVEVEGEISLCRIAPDKEATLEISTSLLRDSRGEPETVVIVIQDLTHRAALERDLRRRDRLSAMGALASGVAHEVRNPLNGISVIVQRLEREFEPQKKREEYLNLTRIVRSEVQRVDRIVRHFLSLARPPNLQLRQIDLETLLEDTIQVVEPRALEKGLSIERHFGNVGQMQADPEQLKQAVLNLLVNALDATEKGRVQVSTRVHEEKNGVEVIVEDSGVGIPPKNLERIFDLYFSTKQDGTGLGLSLVHRIVSEHGGRIEVDSQVGEGTRFILLLKREI